MSIANGPNSGHSPVSSSCPPSGLLVAEATAVAFINCVAVRVAVEEERKVYRVVASTVAVCSIAVEAFDEATIEYDGGVVAIDDGVAS